MTFEFRPYTLKPLATNSGRFVDFAPYVPSINDSGVVAFQATLSDGHSGVFVHDDRHTTDIAVTASGDCPARLFSSHPDINTAGQMTVYGALKTGGEVVLSIAPDGSVEAMGAQHGFSKIGPLGPTMNEQGDIAVRGTLHGGQACIRLRRGDQSLSIAEVGCDFRAFEGLPVVNNEGHVVFRADLPDDRQGIFHARDGQCTSVAVTGSEFTEIKPFPILNGRGMVAFAAQRTSGRPGIYVSDADGVTCVVGHDAGFESFRGILINNTGPIAFYGTPIGGQLGIYPGPDAVRHRLLGLGDTLFGATVVDFALNPVSINECGQIAIRVTLDDKRQFILRGDPAV